VSTRAAIGGYGRGLTPRYWRSPSQEERQPVVSPEEPVTLGLLAPLTLVAAITLGAVALADGASRSGATWGPPVYWSALAVCAAAFAYRLAGSRASRIERIGLVVVFGALLYGVKVLRDPTGFTFADELVHAYNVDSIVSTHSLFAPNAILAVTPHYPGLEMMTAALRLVGGQSTFAAGSTIVVLARLLMMLTLFLVFERVSGSTRVAGLATLLYTASPDFVFFIGAFSYESLALPLAVLAGYSVIRWMSLKEADIVAQPGVQRPRLRYAWGAVAVITISAVIVTHHLTSYVLVIFILALGRAQREIRRLSKSYARPFPFAVFTTVAAFVWLVFAARSTWAYLSQPFTSAVKDAIDTITGHQGGRQLFSNEQDATPLFDRFIAIAAIGLITLGLPFGLKRVWKDHRANAACLVLAVAAVAYVGSVGLRLVPAAWEIGDRASAFLFIGAGLVLALIGLERWGPRHFPWLGRLAVGVVFVVFLEGGMVAGFSANIMLAQTSQIAVGGTTIRPQGYVVAEWARNVLGPDHRFAADESNARLLGAYAHEFAIAGTNPDVQSVIREPKLEGWHVRLLRRYALRYVLVDRRLVSEDALSGYFFRTAVSPHSWSQLFGPRSVHKFDRQPAVSRLLDSGNIVVYDVKKLIQNAP
jgi:hypothetical protein